VAISWLLRIIGDALSNVERLATVKQKVSKDTNFRPSLFQKFQLASGT
jgi:hypothetical protein